MTRPQRQVRAVRAPRCQGSVSPRRLAVTDDAGGLRFEKSEWPVLSSRMAAAAESLRGAIATRDWDAALIESRSLSGVAAAVIGIARSIGPDAPRPTAADLDAFASLTHHAV